MRRAARSVALVAGAGLAVGLAALAGVAIAKTFTLQVAKTANVTNTMGVSSQEPIAVTRNGLAVYTLSGDSKSHPECTAANHCYPIWPPVTVASAKHLSKAHGIKGKLSVWHRDGFNQLVLNGHPLYLFAGDGTHKDFASGQGINSFGGIWRVVPAGASSGAASIPTTPASIPTTPASTPTTPTMQAPPTTPSTPTTPPYYP